MYENTKAVKIRGTEIRLHTYNRSLDLCARMNYEVEVLEFIDSLTCDDVLYDLGAAEGRFAIYAAAKGVRVIAFEPENRNFQVLTDNIQLNPDISHLIAAHNLAVGETNTTSTIIIGQPWAGGHQKVVATAPGRVDFSFDAIEEQPITVVALDDFIQSASTLFPTALKVDVDGSEIPFIQGAQKTLADARLKKVIFELCTVDKSYQLVSDFLQVHGYIETGRYKVPNESDLYNIVFEKNHASSL